MNFAIISPTSGLERYSTLSTTHLVLAHINSPGYKEFYQARRKAGDTLILDNGAHELGAAANWTTLDNAIYSYRPQIVVLPDTLNDPIRTASDSLRYLDRAVARFPEVEWMYVVQAKDGDFCPSVLDFVFNDYRVGYKIKWLGITRYLTIDNGLSRSSIKASLMKYGRKFHALGMVKGLLDELKDLSYSGFDSVDSSVPVWRGWNDHVVGSAEPWPEISVDFSAELPTQLCDHLINTNILTCLEIANADTNAVRRRFAGDAS